MYCRIIAYVDVMLIKYILFINYFDEMVAIIVL